MPAKPPLPAEVARLREKYGTTGLADKLGISKHSLRRNISTGRWSARLAGRFAEIAAAENEYDVPGYGPEKRSRVDDFRAQMIEELRQQYARATVELQEVRYLRKLGDKHSQLDDDQRTELNDNVRRKEELAQFLRKLERYLAVETLDDYLEKLRINERLEMRDAKKAAIRFNLDVRSVYTLFFSPASLGVPA